MRNQDDSDDLQALHNQGQEDGAKGYGNYEPPHGLGSCMGSLAIDPDDYKEKVAENEAYSKGYRNAQ